MSVRKENRETCQFICPRTLTTSADLSVRDKFIRAIAWYNMVEIHTYFDASSSRLDSSSSLQWHVLLFLMQESLAKVMGSIIQ